jgi:Predicted AAA-ATPase/PD-(D/E)XK nuclease superfamily
MRKLPIGVQDFTRLRNTHCVYVDKTREIFHLIESGSRYFFSRPRRFGKSLLVSTMHELFAGKRELFAGLWIENHWNWSQKFPVLHFSFDGVDYKNGLPAAFVEMLQETAAHFKIVLTKKTFKMMFHELITKVHEKHGSVVLLIDEYDKPILDFLDADNMEIALQNRSTMREFYSVLKSLDGLLEFIFITGITKFAKVSIFSDLNHVSDLTFNRKALNLVGYTHEELKDNFGDYLDAIAQEMELSLADLLVKIAAWYNGFSWDGQQKLYNPFGTLLFLDQHKFRSHWFSTGSPRFVVKKMRERHFYQIERTQHSFNHLENADVENVDITTLLFQTGYLTVTKVDEETRSLWLDYPNLDVRNAMYEFLLGDLTQRPLAEMGTSRLDLQQAFIEDDLPRVRAIMNAMLAGLPSETFRKDVSEGLFHGLIHILFRYLGIYLRSEVHSIAGRADALVETATHIYVFEFKLNQTAQTALSQIRRRQYHAPYLAGPKAIRLIGVNFNAITCVIDDWKTQKVTQKKV